MKKSTRPTLNCLDFIQRWYQEAPPPQGCSLDRNMADALWQVVIVTQKHAKKESLRCLSASFALSPARVSKVTRMRIPKPSCPLSGCHGRQGEVSLWDPQKVYPDVASSKLVNVTSIFFRVDAVQLETGSSKVYPHIVWTWILKFKICFFEMSLMQQNVSKLVYRTRRCFWESSQSGNQKNALKSLGIHWNGNGKKLFKILRIPSGNPTKCPK